MTFLRELVQSQCKQLHPKFKLDSFSMLVTVKTSSNLHIRQFSVEGKEDFGSWLEMMYLEGSFKMPAS